MWRRWLAFASYLALGVALTLAAVYLTLYLTRSIPENGAFTRAGAIAGALLVSTVALLGAVFFAVRAAVLLFDNRKEVRK